MTGRRRLLWLALWPVGFAFGFVAELEQAKTGIRDPVWLGTDLLTGWAFMGAGLITWARVPANRIGPLVTAIGFTWFVGTLKPINHELVRWLATGFQGWYEPLLGILPLIYPTGRFASPVARWIGIAWVVELVAWTAARLILERPIAMYGDLTVPGNVRSYVADRELIVEVGAVSLALSVAIAAVTFLWIARRYATASPPARRILAPVLVAGFVLVVVQIGSGAGRISGLVLPFFDTTWFFVVLSVSRVVLAVGVLVGLLRSRLARSGVADLVLRLGPAGSQRSGVERDAESLRQALAAALGDPSVRVARFDEARSSYVDERGGALDLEAPGAGLAVTVLEADGRPTVAIVHDAVLLDDPGLVESMAAAVGLSVDNDRLRSALEARLAEVEESGARIVTAADAERRRLERDLHDGAQQRLVGLSFALRRAQAQAASGTDSELGSTLSEAAAELASAIDELRELARGIHPSILTDGGLGPAIESLARRSAVPVALDLALEPSERLPPAVESTAYFVAAEALTNVARHAGASNAEVRVNRSPERLRLEIVDDGAGGADANAGSGLRGLADRVAALGGSLRVDSPEGQGTRVTAELPLR